MSREKLKALEKLQLIDLELEELSKKADQFPARLKELDIAVARARVAADLERSRVTENERARRQTDNLLADEREKIKKWESRLPALKHPREFAALEREVESGKKQNLAAEEQLTALKADAVTLRSQAKLKDDELAERESELEEEASSLSASESELRGRINELTERRNELRGRCDAKIIATYESIRKRRPGRVLVPLANGSCSGCNRRLPPQLSYKVTSGVFESCPYCYRILFFADPPAESKPA